MRRYHLACTYMYLYVCRYIGTEYSSVNCNRPDIDAALSSIGTYVASFNFHYAGALLLMIHSDLLHILGNVCVRDRCSTVYGGDRRRLRIPDDLPFCTAFIQKVTSLGLVIMYLSVYGVHTYLGTYVLRMFRVWT